MTTTKINPMAWSQHGNQFNLTYNQDTLPDLPMGVYNVQQSKAGLFLEIRPTGFSLPEKIYGLEEAFINRVLGTFKNTSCNLGVLLHGLRGTGKTVTAEILSEQIGLPIILVCQDFPGLIDFMDSIPHSVTFLCDEFEKVFPKSGKDNDSEGGQMERGTAKLLPLMDGVMSGGHRKVFILTTNSLNVDGNLLQRPGRIRYLKPFKNLNKEIIEMIVDDQLERQDSRRDVIDFISRLEIITIDIVKSVVEEMNIHGGSPEALEDVFNVKKLADLFDITMIEDPDTMKKGDTRYDCRVQPWPMSLDHVGGELMVNGRDQGEILAVDGELIKIKHWNSLTDKENEMFLQIKPKPNFNRDVYGGKGAWD